MSSNDLVSHPSKRCQAAMTKASCGKRRVKDESRSVTPDMNNQRRNNEHAKHVRPAHSG